MTPPLARPLGRDSRPIRQRLARLPGPAEASCFLGQLRRPARRSAARALADGLVVIVTLKRHGARPLFTTREATEAVYDPDRSIRVAAAVDAALGLIPVAPTCLRRSVTLLRELRRLGLVATMHVGVKTVAGAVEAHAWVQAGDVLVNDDPEVVRGYVELAKGELERLLPLLQ